MTNKDIKKAIYQNDEVLALYWGENLIYSRAPETPTYGPNILAGKFDDSSKSTDWYWTPNNNKTTITVDPDTKEFVVQFDNNLTYASSLFYKSKVERIDHIPDTSNATYMTSMFKDCTYLKSVNVSDLNTAKSTSLAYMFQNCSLLEAVDLSSFETSKVTAANLMFQGCSVLKSLDISSFDLSAMTDMNGFANNCTKLETLTMTGCDFSLVSNMNSFVIGCTSLKDIVGPFTGISVNNNLKDCPLTNESAMTFINALSRVTDTKTLTFKSTTYNTLTKEQIAVATSKGWTLAKV